MESKTCVGIGLVIVSSILFLMFLIFGKTSFINLRSVIIKHLKLFADCKLQYLVFYVFPLAFSIGLSMVYIAKEPFYSDLSVIIGILLSMQFAILTILTGYDFSSVKDKQQKGTADKVVSETINTIIFNSILSVFLMLYGLVIIVLSRSNLPLVSFDLSILKMISSCIAYYVFIVILLDLLLIVKRMSKIVEFNLNVKRENDK